MTARDRCFSNLISLETFYLVSSNTKFISLETEPNFSDVMKKQNFFLKKRSNHSNKSSCLFIDTTLNIVISSHHMTYSVTSRSTWFSM
mmetsp:Transcript_14542/g.20742  ORF Transcript_14542/g.20742 Transcript_14542/m.20742 type:complete len:88 (+) Transcript_14542:474-737(+)